MIFHGISRHPNPTEVVVSVKYCGLNFFDNYLCLGLSPEIKLPCVLGLECAGIVVGCGDKVSKLQVNDRVIVHCPHGGALSEYVTVNELQVLPIPAQVEFSKAASLTVNYLTSYFTLIEIGGLKEGSSVFIQGAAGGVGWAATQIAKLFKNVTVFGTASSQKHEAIKANGVDYPLSYDQNIKKEIQAVCPNGVSIVLENLGGEAFRKSQEFIHPLGKVVLIGDKNMLSREKLGWLTSFWAWWNKKDIVMHDLILNNKCIAGFHLNQLLAKSPEKFRWAWSEILKLYLEKKIDPKIDSIYSIHDVKTALQRMLNRENVGKILVEL